MREQVNRARQVQRQRFGPESPRLNSRMSSRQLRRYSALDQEGRSLLKNAMDELGLSARAHDRILRVARTIADLEGTQTSSRRTWWKPSAIGVWIGSYGQGKQLGGKKRWISIEVGNPFRPNNQP